MIPDTPPQPASSLPGPGAPPSGARRVLPWVWRLVSVRLRFLIVLALGFVVVAEWEVLRNYWDKVTQGALHVDPGLQSVSADTEYFCPMDPGVVSDWPGKCGVCNMGLVRRKRGDATLLPDGVVARMQFSPYRIQLAGIRTTPVGYRKLVQEVEGAGKVLHATSPTNARAEAELTIFASQLPGLAEGQEALVVGSGFEPLQANVQSVLFPSDPAGGEARVRLDVADPLHRLEPGAPIRARFQVLIATVEPFRSMPKDPPPLLAGEKRTVYRCSEHSDVVSQVPARCPKDRAELERHDLEGNQRLRWWCPMHPNVTSDRPGGDCRACGGMKLVPTILSFNPPGEVLAVPESSVVDTGSRTLVYVERMQGMFDGVEVILGLRCGDAYPVVRGLESGQRVVTAGSFLVDAETRLNPSAAASYFGAGRRDASVASSPSAVTASKSNVSTSETKEGSTSTDEQLIARQRLCPVTGKPLGSMGAPKRVEIAGRTVFLCCDGCEDALRKDPAKFLAKLPNQAQH
jgi:membrane fusion protein, copper/silver efflux system